MDRFTAHIDRAWDYITRGDTAKAQVAARRALEIDRESPEVHNLLGFISALNGEVEEALLSYRHAMDLDEEYVDPILNTAELLVHAETDPEEAIRLCRSATRITSGREELVDAILLEVDALLSMGSTEEARERLGDIVDPESLPSAYGLLVGRAFYEAGDPRSAESFIEKAIVDDPKSANAWYYKGLIARDNGRMSEAQVAFEKVLELDASAKEPPWTKYLEPIENLVAKAVAVLEEALQKRLTQTEFVICDNPSKEQVQSGMDPRQIAVADGLDAQTGEIGRLWIFSMNLLRSGILPDNAVDDLADIIEQELQTLNNSV